MNKVLVVVDYQNDFVSGALGFDGADSIEENILSLIKEFRENMDQVIFTKDTHYPNYLETVEGKKLPVEHCLKGSWGHELTDNVKKEVKYSQVIEKESFPSLQLANVLHGLNPKEIHLCGLVSDICVISNAVIAKAACPNAEIYIHKDASESYDHDMQEKAYQVAEHLHINVI